MRALDQKRFDELITWAHSHGATLHPSVEIYHDETTKFSFRVKPDSPTVNSDATVVTCPLSITISFLNAIVDGPLTPSSLGRHTAGSFTFPATFMSDLPSHVIGRFYLMHQYLLGPSSPWYPYIATLPQPEHLAAWSLPAFWSDEDLAPLEGTNLDGAAEATREHARREFKAARRLLREDGFPEWQDYSRTLYHWALCVFTSRSFRTGLVVPDAAREDIDRLLSLLPDNVSAEAGPRKPSVDDFSVLMPLFDVANHDVRARIVWDIADPDGCCSMRVRQRYAPGEQVFNNYGLKTNSELLLGYGFMVPETDNLHNDYVHLQRKAHQPNDEDEDLVAAESTAAGEDITRKPEERAKRFLVSLRPMQHESSAIGRSRMRSLEEMGFTMPPPFAHLEGSLILDLAQAQMTDDARTALEQLLKSLFSNTAQLDVAKTQPDAADRQTAIFSREDAMLVVLLRSPPDPKLDSLVREVTQLLIEKLEFDLARLEDLPEDDEAAVGPADSDEATKNQLLAWHYRKQCQKVLMNAIVALKQERHSWGIS